MRIRLPSMLWRGAVAATLTVATLLPGTAAAQQATATATTAPPAPVVTQPKLIGVVTASQTRIAGSAAAGSLVRVWLDADRNGRHDSGETMAAQQQLLKNAKDFGVTVTLAPNVVHNFVVTAADVAGRESAAARVPTIIQDSGPPVISNVSDTPDPFSPNKDTVKDQVAISYTLSEAALVLLRINDPSGKLVRPQLELQREAGPQTETWDGTQPDGSRVPDGAYSLSIDAVDAALNRAVQQKGTLHIDTVAPQTTITAGPTGETTSTSASFSFSSDDPSATFECKLDGAAFGVCDSPRALTGLAQSAHTFSVRGVDAAGNTDATPASATWTVKAGVPPPPPPPPDDTIPPDPSSIAPPLQSGVASSVSASVEFLYSGSNPIQTGVAPGVIQSTRASVLRGRVQTRDGQPLSGVRASIVGHPELGRTVSRADGAFDLVVNGGGPLAVEFSKTGYLTAQRSVDVRWQDYQWLPNVSLVQLDTQVTSISLAAGAPLQVARASQVTDNSGVRRATLLFPQGTTAELVMADGTIRPASELHVRATEYTVGAGGQQAMPGDLPQTTAYTYAVEMSADEAQQAGATEVRFNRPVVNYVENFLNFPVGWAVPTAWYDRTSAEWNGAPNGRIIKLLSVQDGAAVLDVTGSGQSADAAALASLGIDDAERQALAGLYTAGQSFWRVPIPHFTPWDHNFPYAPENGARAPALPQPQSQDKRSNTTESTQCGSLIGCESQTLGESVPVVGTPFSLNYASDRTPGRVGANQLRVPITGATVPGPLVGITARVEVAGQVLEKRFPPQPNQSWLVQWDGKDGYGRDVNGVQPTRISVGYEYNLVYTRPADFDQAWGNVSSTSAGGVVASRGDRTVMIWQQWMDRIQRAGLGGWDARGVGLGGWTLDVQHAYDPLGHTLYLGSGEQQRGDPLGQGITSVAGSSIGPGFGGDSGPSTNARLSSPSGVAVAPDGTLYISDTGNGRVRKVAPDGIISTVAGGGSALQDGVPATQTLLDPYGIVVAPDGSLLIADNQNNRVRQVLANGTITTLVEVPDPSGLALATDGSLFISQPHRNRIMRLGPDGVLSAFAGNGNSGTSGDGGFAASASINSPWGIATAPDGSLYIAEFSGSRIRRVTPDGKISSVVGGAGSSTLDGVPSISASVVQPRGVGVASDGTLYYAETLARPRVRKVSSDGIVTTVAGTGERGFSGDGGIGTAAKIENPWYIAATPDGGLVFADGFSHRVRQLGRTLPGFTGDDILIPSGDGARVYHFDASGRHLQTIDALTGSIDYTFTYDAGGQLATIQDDNRNVTRIERDGQGRPTAIVGPYGQRTELRVDANGWVERIANPAGEAVSLVTQANGLLQTLTDARNGVHQFAFDPLGRLIRDQDPLQGVRTLDHSDRTDGHGHIVTYTSPEGRVTTYNVEDAPDGTVRTTTTYPDSTHTVTSRKPNGVLTATYPSGLAVTTTTGPDPRWGMLAPMLVQQDLVTPHGLTQTVTQSSAVDLRDPFNPLSLVGLHESVDLNGISSSVDYDATTRTLETTSALGRKSVLVLDDHGRVAREQAIAPLPQPEPDPCLPQCVLAPPAFDAAGPLFAATYAYDDRGRLRSRTDGEGADARVTSLTYRADGTLESVSDPLGRVTRFDGYDAAGRPASKTLPGGGVIGYGWDAASNMTAITPPGRPRHLMEYDLLNQAIAYVAPAAQVGGAPARTEFAHNRDGMLTGETGADGDNIAYQPDAAGRSGSINVARGSITPSYDTVTGMLTSLAAPGGVGLAYTYDGDLLTSETWSGPVSGVVGHAFDSQLRPSAISVAGTSTAFQFDDDGGLVQSGDLHLDTDATSGFVNRTTLGSVIGETLFDRFGELRHLATSANGTNLFTLDYVRDRLGRISESHESVAGEPTHVTGYSYDDAGRLKEIKRDGLVQATYTYDANGNRQVPGTPATYDDQDRLVQRGSMVYTYSLDGDLRSRSDGAQAASFVYDAFGNLTSATLADGRAVDYLVDGQNRRIGKKIGGSLVQGFLYVDGLRVAAELDGTSNVVSRFVYGEGQTPSYMTRGGRTYRLVVDNVGSVRLAVDAQTGQIVQRLEYDAWGNVTMDTNPGFQPFGFAGGLYDRDTGLIRFGARDYDPVAGRWTIRDPMLFGGGDTNLYAYAANDPINMIDPTGLFARVCNDKNNITITLPISYSGKGATKKVVKKFNDAIEKQWTGQFGKYNVKMIVTEGTDNTITVPVGDGDAAVQLPGRNTGHWPSKRVGSVAAHESGHLMGLDDRYADTNKDGFWEPSEQDPAWVGNLMADPEHGSVFDQDIFMILISNHALDSGNCDCKK